MQAFPVTSNQLEWLAATQALCLTHTHPKWFPPVSLTGSLALQPHCRVYIYSSNLVLTNRKRQLKCVDKMKPTCLMRSCCSSNKQLKPTDASAQEVLWRLVRRRRDAWIALVQHMDPWLDWDLGSLESGSTCQSPCSHHRAVAEHFVSCGEHPFWRRDVSAVGEQCCHRRCAGSTAIFTWSGSSFKW